MSANWPAAKNEAVSRLREDLKSLHLETRISTSHSELPSRIDPVVVPIYHSATYRFKSVEQFSENNHGDNHVYRRCGNPTVENVEVIINEIEGGAACLLYNSGLAAAQAVLLEFLNAGDHLICMTPMYSGSFSFITKTMTRFGVEVTFVDVEKEADFAGAVEKQLKANTKMIFIEAIANPTMAVPDIKGVVAVAQKHKLLSFVDSTFASPYNLQPIKLGADFSMHSCSKYIGGHSDVIAGCVTARELANWQRLKSQQLTTGSSLSPFDAAFLTRGLKTLVLRMKRINENALKVAKFLEKHPDVKAVFYPGLESHPQHVIAKDLLKEGFGGMIAFELDTEQKAIKVVENVRIIVHAVSLGGTESLIEHPGSMSHGKQLLHGNEPMVSEGLIRLSIGIEDPDDLIADLNRALTFTKNA